MSIKNCIPSPPLEKILDTILHTTLSVQQMRDIIDYKYYLFINNGGIHLTTFLLLFI